MLDPQRTVVLIRRHWWGHIADTVICGWNIAENYILQGYEIDREATHAARRRIATTTNGETSHGND